MSSLLFVRALNIQSVLSTIRRKALSMGDLKTSHARAMVYIEKWIQRNFKEQGALAMDGAQWAPLKPSTIKRRRHGPNKSLAGQVKILEDKGWLKTRWKPFYSPWKVAYQSSMNYGIYHDSDGTRSGKLPQRRIVPRQRQVRSDIRRIYMDHVREVLRLK